jgi:stage II sporulation protein M
MTISQAIEKLFPEKPVRRYVVFMALLFAVAFPAGLFANDPALRGLAKTFVDMTGAPTQEMAGGSFFLFILMNNMFASLLLLFFGVFGGVIPVLSVGTNGFMLGMVYRHISESAGTKQAMLDIVPQSLFEIPALFIIAAYGLWLGVGSIRRLRGNEERAVKELINIALQRYFTLAFPLLVVAAAAETFMMIRG